MDQDRMVYIVVDREGAPYRVLLYQPGIRFSLLTNSKVLSLQQQAWWNMQYGNQIPSQWHQWAQIWGFTWIHLWCLHILTRSPCIGACMPVVNWFLSSLSKRFCTWIPYWLWLVQGLAMFSQKKYWMWQVQV